MKNSIILYISSLFFMISIFSCSEPIDIDIDESQKVIVLNSLINPDSTITVNI